VTERAALVYSAMMLVPDASVAAKWYLEDEELVAQANGMLDRYAAGHVSFAAPDSIFYELAGLVRTAERRSPPRITAQQADAIYAATPTYALDRSVSAGVSLYPA
jgi:predicted nucleic acid-binding protein